MAYIKDLACCKLFPDRPIDNLAAVGWLSKDHPMTTGPVSIDFFEKLCTLLMHAWQPFISAGTHECDLCQFSGTANARYKDYSIKSAATQNLFIPFSGKIYIAPESIAHYINAHYYKPPQEFIAAVIECPPMNSMDYKRLLLANGGGKLLKSATD